MRSVLTFLFFTTTALLAGCSDETNGAGEGAGGSASGTATSADASSSATTGSGQACGGPLSPGECAPEPASCEGSASACLAPEAACDTDPKLLRMVHLTFSEPSAFTDTVGEILTTSVAPNAKDCFLNGTGVFSWLIELDAGKGTIKTGTAKDSDTASSGYCFDNGSVNAGGKAYTVVPTIGTATVGADGTLDAEVIDSLTIAAALGRSNYIMLPFQQLQFHDTTVSPDGACIGAFNIEGLKQDDLCIGSSETPSFVGGGAFDAYITLEEADSIVIDTLGMTLCVLLTNDSDFGSPKMCKRTNGVIDAKGDWCAMSNHAATPTCFDAVHVSATFAASAVVRKGGC